MINPKKNLAFDASWPSPTGIGRVAKEVLDRTDSGWETTKLREGRKNAGIFTPIDLYHSINRIQTDLFWSPGFIPPIDCSHCPVVVTVHDLTHLHYYRFYHKLYFNLIIKSLLHKVSAVVTVSDFTRDELLQWSGLSESRVFRIHNAVSDQFQPIGAPFNSKRPYIFVCSPVSRVKNVRPL